MRNYGVAIILFTVILNLAMFPTYVKQQKSMAGNTRMQKKMRELQKIYKDDKRKLQEEQQSSCRRKATMRSAAMPGA